MAKINYEKYLVKKPVYEASEGTKNRQSLAMTILSDNQVPGCNHLIEVGWIYGIPDPNPGIHEHVHDYDEIIIHWGGDYKNPQVLGGRHVTEKVGTGCGGNSTAYSPGDMVISGRDISYQRTQYIERCPLADSLLQADVSLYMVQRQMPWAFHHYLNAGLLGSLNQFP